MKIDQTELEVNGVIYIPKSEVVADIEGDVKIVILQRGWAMVGILERNGPSCKLRKSSTIRRWGTEHGLGQIAKDGPTTETKLDKNNGIVEFDWLTVVASIACEESKWKNEL